MELNSTIWIQIGIFLYVILMLRSLFFGPIMKILDKRKELTHGRDDAASGLQKEIAEMRSKIDSEVGSLKASLEDRRHETIRRNREITEKKILDATERVEKQVSEKRIALLQEFERLQQKLPSLSESVSSEIVSALTNSRVVRR